MAFYQDSKGNYVSGEGPGTQYNYTNTAGQYVDNSGSNGPKYMQAPSTAKLPEANPNRPDAPYGQAAMSDLSTKPLGEGSLPMFRGSQFLGYSQPKTTAMPQSYSLTGSQGTGYTPNPSAGATYTPNVGIPAATPQPSGYQLGGMKPPAYDPKFNYSNNTPMPQNNAVSMPGMMSDSKLGSNPQTPNVTPMAYTPNMGNNYGMGSFEKSQFGYPAMPQQSSGIGGSGTTAFPVKTPDQIKAEAKARTDALLAKQTTIANQTKQGFNTSFDRLQSQTKDDRTLQDAAFQTRSDPYNGMTGFQKDMTGRQREISDQQSRQDLQTRLANVDLSLADYANANDAQRMQMEDQMTQAERAYGMQVDQFNLQRQGQALGQFNADRSFNYGATQDQIKNGQWSQTFNQNQSNADRTFNAGRQDVAYNHGQDQITNNRNAANDAATYTANYTSPQTSAIMQKIAANSSSWFNATPSERTRLAAENQSLGASIGAKQDESGNWVMPQPQRTVAGMQMDSQAKEVAYNHARDSVKDDQWKQTFDYNKQQNDVQQTAQYAGMYNGQPTMQKIMQNATIANMTADNLRSAASEARASGNNQLAKRFDIWDRTGVAPEGIPGVAAGTQLGGKKSTTQTAETYAKVVDKVAQYVTDPDTKVKKLSNPQQVEDTILLSGLSDYEQYKLYMQHGLKWDDPIPKAPGKP